MGIYTFVVFLTLSLSVLTYSQTVHPDSYYAKFAKDGKQHTMVQHQGIGTLCDTANGYTVVRKGAVTAAEKTQFLKDHNDYRRKVAKGLETRGSAGAQPSASDMRELTWDDELAAFAQRWAEQCPAPTHPHDDIRRNDAYSWVGQNMFSDTDQSMPALGTPDPPLTANSATAMKFWSLESEQFDNSKINPFAYVGATGHYTQLVWADSEKLGCGFVMTKKEETIPFGTMNSWKRYIICNFGPGGNINGLTMYKSGAAASNCPTGTLANDGLCKADATATTTAAATTAAPTTAAPTTAAPTTAAPTTAAPTTAAPTTAAPTTAAPTTAGPTTAAPATTTAASNVACTADQFKCGNGLCIPKVKKCNGHNDCSDGSDESSTACTCSPKYQFQCGSKCVPTFWVCDHHQDCPDNSDEADALCKSPHRVCPRPTYEFRCMSGRCIEKTWKCDGRYDCPNGDDELNC